MLFKSSFLQAMQARGFIQDITHPEALDQYFLKPNKAYIGFDLTAPSLHVGSLMQIMICRLLQAHGHTPILLFGGATTLIGDPSFKDDMRKMLSPQEIENNRSTLTGIFKEILDFNAPNKPIIVNNKDWLGPMNYIDILRDFGVHFSVNRMLSFDSVKLRMEREHSLSFLEFNYMILQAIDFYELYKQYDCGLQIGGSDQWGNIINGVELIRRKLNQDSYGLVTPLLTTSSGKKMGKTESGAVWLNEAQLSHYDFWQYWRNTEDADVIKFLKLFTDLPLTTIADYEQVTGKALNEVKITLANEVTRIVRGKTAAEMALATASSAFEHNDITAPNLPEIHLTLPVLQEQKLIKILSDYGVTASASESRRLVKEGGVKINDVTVKEESFNLTKGDFIYKYNEQACLKLSIGKKKHIRVLLSLT